MQTDIKQPKVLVTGAGGFIGYHLVEYLRKDGFWVRGVDIKLPEFGATSANEFYLLDLRDSQNCIEAMQNIEYVYALAADMGGMGFISSNHSTIMHNNLLINLHCLEAARLNSVKRYLFSSSACVYPEYLQNQTQITPLKEEDAYPAQPQDAYGWEKLTTEKMCKYYQEEFGIEIRIVRLHNIFGPYGTWTGGREKAPAAFCRKIAYAKLCGTYEIEIWGDGEQTRSFCYISDCIKGLYQLMQSDYCYPLNLGQSRLVTINQLVDIIAQIAQVNISKKHIIGPQGVRGRNCDRTRIHDLLGWEPLISLDDGLRDTYYWIEEQVKSLIG